VSTAKLTTSEQLTTMKPNLFFGLLAAIFLLAGCSSTPTTKTVPGVIHARTFSFVNQRPRPEPVFSAVRKATCEQIQEDIARNLAARGVAQVASGGDITVEFLILIGNPVATEAIDDYFDYGEGGNEQHDKLNEIYNENNSSSYLNRTTLFIDIVDTKNHTLLMRQSATRPFVDHITREERARRIHEMVDEIFQKLNVVNPK
jgi:Domain of unknown function (DUF4136)